MESILKRPQTVWSDPHAMDFFDDDHSYEEDRFLKVGYSTSSKILLVVYCEIDQEITRIISARKATKAEKKDYESGI